MMSKKFSLKWNNFSQYIVAALEDLRGDDELTDVTLSCDGKRIKCHKVLLSACSVYFKEIFRENPCKHPVIILKGVEHIDLQAIVTFMYNGEVNVNQERLSTFLQTAELLQIKGLTEIKETTPKGNAVDTKVTNSYGRHDTFSERNSRPTDMESSVTSTRSPVAKRRRIAPTNFVQNALPNQSAIAKQLFDSNESQTHKVPHPVENNLHEDDILIDDISDPNTVVAGYSGSFLDPEIEPINIISSPSSVPIPNPHHQESFYSNNHSITPEHTNDTEYEDYKYEAPNLSEENSINEILGEIENDNSGPPIYTIPDEPNIKVVNKTPTGPFGSFTPIEDQKVAQLVATKRGYKIKLDEHMYTKDKAILDKAYWRCINNQRFKCKGRLLLINDQICGTKPHNAMCTTNRVSAEMSLDND